MSDRFHSFFPPATRRGALNTKLQWQRRLGWEPKEFKRLAPTLSRIEGWRYRQDLVLLYLLARDLPPGGVILEIGSYKGLATTTLAFGARDGGHEGVHTVDPHTGDLQALKAAGAELLPSEDDFKRNLARSGVADHVVSYTMTSDELATRWEDRPIRLLFIDGWHSYDGAGSDIHNWAPLVVPSGVVVVDDYHNYPEVERAVEDAADLLPARRARAGRMHLASQDPLPSSVERYLRIPWG
jgi:predicted O-methyltransferase YrrM